jgi:hypothetical protein
MWPVFVFSLLGLKKVQSRLDGLDISRYQAMKL